MNNTVNINILDLPHVVLKKILYSSNLSNLDCICLSLTCNKLFHERDKYLYLNSKENSIELKFLFLKSYNKVCQFIVKENEPIIESESIETPIDIPTILSDLKNPYSINSMYLNSLTGIDGFPIEYLSLLPRSIRCLSISSDVPTNSDFKLSVGAIPPTITNLNFSEAPSELLVLEPGIIPLSCTILNLSYALKNPLKPGDIPLSVLKLTMSGEYPFEIVNLPECLLKLRIAKSRFNSCCFRCNSNKSIQEIKPNTLPSTIISIHFYLYHHMFLPNTLPPGLKSLKFQKYYKMIETGVLPYTLEKLKISSPLDISKDAISYPPNGQSLPKLTIYTNRYVIYQDKVRNLPTSVFEIIETSGYIRRRVDDQIFITNE